jgi:hypothetical protein
VTFDAAVAQSARLPLTLSVDDITASLHAITKRIGGSLVPADPKAKLVSSTLEAPQDVSVLRGKSPTGTWKILIDPTSVPGPTGRGVPADRSADDAAGFIKDILLGVVYYYDLPTRWHSPQCKP